MVVDVPTMTGVSLQMVLVVRIAHSVTGLVDVAGSKNWNPTTPDGAPCLTSRYVMPPGYANRIQPDRAAPVFAATL